MALLEPLDPSALARDLAKLTRATAVLAAVGVGFSVGFGLTLWTSYTDLALALVVTFPLAFVFVITYAEMKLRESHAARERVKRIIHQEWETRQEILPPDFRIPSSHCLFRSPPVLNRGLLLLLRLGKRSERGPFFPAVLTGIGAIPVATLLGVLFFRLRIDFFLIPVVIGFVALPVFHWKIHAGIALLREAREYERITGQGILPIDLRPEARGESQPA